MRQFALLKDFKIGQGIHFKGMEVLIAPDDSYGLRSGDQEVVGVLGLNMNNPADIELDVANKKMNLYSQDHCPGNVVYWAGRYDATPFEVGQLGEIYFPMELEGKKIESTFDSGTPSTSLYTDITKSLFDFDSHSSGIETKTYSDGRTASHYRAMNLTSDHFQVVNADVYLLEKPFPDCVVTKRRNVTGYDGCLGNHPLHLGRDVLSRLHIYIATKEKMLYFTPAGETKEHAAK